MSRGGQIVTIILRFLAAGLAAVMVFLILLFAIQFRNRRRAEELLRAVRVIHVGESTAQDVRNATRGFVAVSVPAYSSVCPTADSSYTVAVANYTLNGLGMSFSALRRIGLEPWGVVTEFLFAQGRVCDFYYTLGLLRPNEWKQLKIGVEAPPTTPGVKAEPYYPHYVTGKIINFTTFIYPDATAEQRRRAFDFDLSCLTRIGGCTNVCEIIPSAWPDYVEKARERGFDLPPNELADNRCNKMQRP
jgi:hypothetical protein